MSSAAPMYVAAMATIGAIVGTDLERGLRPSFSSGETLEIHATRARPWGIDLARRPVSCFLGDGGMPQRIRVISVPASMLWLMFQFRNE
ncbi:hypothetical protein ACVWZL_007434 [Bradyrhizobium sp. GM2.4]